jgi:tetratricopeptide (TPR) repeat protein
VLRNLFGKRDIDELAREAEALFSQGQFGEAKLAYDRVAERAAKVKPELCAPAEARVVECCDRLALARAEEALTLFAGGQEEFARSELKHALETARSEPAQTRVRELANELERKQAVVHAEEAAAPLSDEERWVLITSSWESLQAEELERYGAPLEQALLALERAEAQRALELLTLLKESAKEPSYLWLEIARAQLALGALDDAEAALRTFLSRIAADEGGTARLLAHRELARIAHERGQHEAAIAELEASAGALADDPRPYLDLGNYLRVIERPKEAVEVLELCAALFGDRTVEWPVTMELGLACAAAGDEARAIQLLESVLETLITGGQRDLPPPAAVELAKLHEKAGNVTRAADLYRALTEGSDGENHARYHEEAARLLDVLQLTEEARRMRERAVALRARG